MAQVNGWKDWLLWPLRTRFGTQAGKPPAEHDLDLNAQGLLRLSEQEWDLFEFDREWSAPARGYTYSDADFKSFLGWDELPEGRCAVFKMETQGGEGGYVFERKSYAEVQIAGAAGARFFRPDEHLKALRDFHQRFGEPEETDLEDPYPNLKTGWVEGELQRRMLSFLYLYRHAHQQPEPQAGAAIEPQI